MLMIACPFCGPRESAEFSYGGDASVVRPSDPAAVSDTAWTEYLFQRDNPKGTHLEHWFHRDGCRSWLRVERSTVTHEIGPVWLANRSRRQP
jgi:heterotetrameric sarcosine oxidase delta subunit